MTGEQFRSIRKGLKLTQAQLAERLGRVPQTICHLETGKLPVKPETALAMRRLRDEDQARFNP